MENIKIKGELLFTLNSKQQWVNRVPSILPDKIRRNEKFLWVDKNGNIFESGEDFTNAEKIDSYPCKVYRLFTVTQAVAKADKDVSNNNKITRNEIAAKQQENLQKIEPRTNDKSIAYGFHLTKEQLQKCVKWKNSLPKKHFGAIQGEYSFVFTETTLGEIVKVKRVDGFEIDITDYDSF